MSKSSGRRNRRVKSAEFKAKVALAALREDKALAEFCQQFELHLTQNVELKKQLLNSAAGVFGSSSKGQVDLVPLHTVILPFCKGCGIINVTQPWPVAA